MGEAFITRRGAKKQAGGSPVWLIPQPDESKVGAYYLALAHGTLGVDEASSDISIVYGNAGTMTNLCGTLSPRSINCFTDTALTVPTTIASTQIVGVWFGSLFNDTSIGNYFLNNYYAFNQPLTIPNSITSIGGYFMNNCYAFNQPLTIPNSITSIGGYFMNSCYAFNQPLTISSGVTSIGNSFLYDCYKMTSLITWNSAKLPTDNYSLSSSSNIVPMYKQGIPIGGTNAAAVLAALPNRTSSSSPYRNLRAA